MKKIYLIKLNEFEGFSEVSWLDNKEWFDWIYDFIPDSKDPSVGTYRSFADRYVPESLIDYAFSLPEFVKETQSTTKEDLKKELYNHLSSGSYENDKAMMLSTILSFDTTVDHIAPETTKKLVKWLADNDYEIIDEYEGMIY